MTLRGEHRQEFHASSSATSSAFRPAALTRQPAMAETAANAAKPCTP
jgi:hypothetical protein